ncbi:MAG: SDR family NAD(P)-dependent oxidoreductase, partial [Gammaproteobacteria bacterium]|nr:SDR family NAD(P)-dependent oxidoreductase [Gammaproteobacteria bacterium]
MNMTMPRLLLFGGTGAIGSGIQRAFEQAGWQVAVVSRKPATKPGCVCWDPLRSDDESGASAVRGLGPFDAVCWSRGMNASDSVYDADLSLHERMYHANCTYILAS